MPTHGASAEPEYNMIRGRRHFLQTAQVNEIGLLAPGFHRLAAADKTASWFRNKPALPQLGAGRSIDAIVPAGDAEFWETASTSPMAFPFRIHGVQVQAIERDSRPPKVYEQRLKDTVQVNSSEPVRLVMQIPPLRRRSRTCITAISSSTRMPA